MFTLSCITRDGRRDYIEAEAFSIFPPGNNVIKIEYLKPGGEGIRGIILVQDGRTGQPDEEPVVYHDVVFIENSVGKTIHKVQYLGT